jgi:hypothetical protein
VRRQGVVPVATIEQVRTRAAVEKIVTLTPVELVVAVLTVEPSSPPWP